MMKKKFNQIRNFIKTNKLYLVLIFISVFIYSIILGFFGIFGESVKSVLIYFVNNILPIIAICFGYFMTIFVPIRVIQAMQKNKEIREDFEQDKKLQEYANREHELKQKILNAMGNEGRL